MPHGFNADSGKRSPMPSAEALKAADTLIHVLWINAGLSCDGDSVALTAATQPSIEEIALGALPGLPQVAVHLSLLITTHACPSLPHAPHPRSSPHAMHHASR